MYGGMEFKSLTLDNGLQILTVSDRRFKKSSASLAVQVGSMQEPREHLGLAHFLEHMLFLGTKEFPEVGQFEDFLEKNGGGNNAYTDTDHTNYFFQVDPLAYSQSLKKFSRFFVSPLFTPEYSEREKKAVHSEHQKNLKSDGWREHRMRGLILDPNHPRAQFATGDKNTLAQVNRKVLVDFYERYYSAPLMRLVLMGPQSSLQLREWATEYFSDVPNRKGTPPQVSQEVFKGLKLPRLFKLKTLRDTDVLRVDFSIPDTVPYWKSKPVDFLSHLIGHEGQGSLLSFLKEKGWALGLSSGADWRIFTVRITLTEKGREEFKEVLKSLFSYIHLLKKEGLKSYAFEENQKLAQAQLDYLEPKSSMSHASRYSATLLYYPVEDFIAQAYLYHEPSAKDFEMFLNRLRPDNMQVLLLSKFVTGNQREKYYGLEYSTEDFDPSWVGSLESVEVYKGLSFPAPNPYVPTDFTLVSGEKKIGPPHLENHGSFAKLGYQVDTQGGIPKSLLSVNFISDVIQGDPLSYLLADLFVTLKNEELNEWGYSARLGGLSYDFSHELNTLSLSLQGYSHHLVQLAKDIIYDSGSKKTMNHVSMKRDLFEKIKAKVKKNFSNWKLEPAYQRLSYEGRGFFPTAAVHRDEFVDLLDGIDLEQVNEFGKKFFHQVRLELYGYGNVKPGELKGLADYFFEVTKAKGFTEEQVKSFTNRYVKFPDQKLYHSIKGLDNNNAQYSLYYFSDWTVTDAVYAQVIGKLLSQPYFKELRTHQQLGYIVTLFPTVGGGGFVGLGALIQSQSHGALDIFQRSESFIKESLKKISQTVTDGDIKNIKHSLVEEWKKPPNTLSERFYTRFFPMASKYEGDFDLYKKKIQVLEAISGQSVRGYLTEKGWADKGSPSQFVFLYSGSENPSPSVLSIKGFTQVGDLQSFKKKQPTIQPYGQNQGPPHGRKDPSK